jgi:DNA-binding response OmpR family regulator
MNYIQNGSPGRGRAQAFLMKLLVVEDEVPTAAFLRRGLTEEGYAVDVARDGPSADEAVAVNDYDAIVLDVMLPGTDGFRLCEQWRGKGLRTPILFLTARDDVTDRVRGLDIGGDDYLIKPFAFDELLARMRVLLRRRPSERVETTLSFADVTINTNRRQVMRAGKTVPLSTREYQLFEYLARNAGRVVTRSALWEHVWESHSVPDSNIIDVYVRYLRNKLGRNLIETVRGAGYAIGLNVPSPRKDPLA